MSIRPESRLGIGLNTPIRYLEETAEQNLRGAKNDASWFLAVNTGAVPSTSNVVFLMRSAHTTRASTTNKLDAMPTKSSRHQTAPNTSIEARKIPGKFIRWLAKRDARRLTARVLARIRPVENPNSNQTLFERPKH